MPPPWIRTDNWLPVYGPLVGREPATPFPSATGLGREPPEVSARAAVPARPIYGAGASFIRKVTPTSSDRTLVHPAADRLAVLLVAGSGATFEIMNDGRDGTGGQGLSMIGQGLRALFTRNRHGNLVTGGIWCVQGLTVQHAIIEVFAKELQPDPSSPWGVKMRHPVSAKMGNITATTTATKILNANPYRYAITWGSPLSIAVWLGTDSNIANLNGLPIPTAGNPWTITELEYGDIIKGEWWVVASAATTAFGWTEIFADTL